MSNVSCERREKRFLNKLGWSEVGIFIKEKLQIIEVLHFIHLRSGTSSGDKINGNI